MKRYKLLKDLPTFSKGATFQLTNGGHLMSEETRVIAFAESTLKQFNILDSDWFEEIPEDYKRWRADKNGQYWYVKDYGVATDDYEIGARIDGGRYEFGNYFKTEEEAEKAAEWLKALTVLRDDTKGFKPSWWNCDQEKWVVEYRPHDDVQLVADYYRYVQNGVIYFATKDDALESIKKHEREWKTFYGVEE